MTTDAADNRLNELVTEVGGLTFEVTATYASAAVPNGWEAVVTAYHHTHLGPLGDKAGVGKTPDGESYASLMMAVATAAEAFRFTSE